MTQADVTHWCDMIDPAGEPDPDCKLCGGSGWQRLSDEPETGPALGSNCLCRYRAGADDDN